LIGRERLAWSKNEQHRQRDHDRSGTEKMFHEKKLLFSLAGSGLMGELLFFCREVL